MHAALKCSARAARGLRDAWGTSWPPGAAVQGMVRPSSFTRVRCSLEDAASEQAGCCDWVPPLPHGQTSSPSVTCRESGPERSTGRGVAARRAAGLPSACARADVSGDGGLL